MKLRRSSLIFLGLSIIVLVAWLSWRAASLKPLYATNHRHESLPSHEHIHTHGDGVSHGHDHFGLIGTTSHAHAHQHDHHHQNELTAPGTEGLTQFGHRHGAKTTEHFWGHAVVQDRNQLVVELWVQRGQQLEVVSATDCDTAQVFNGSQPVCEVDFSWSKTNGIATMPANVFFLPTQVVKLSRLKIEGTEFNAVFPLEQKMEAAK